MRSTTLAAPLLLALQREILEREAWPVLRVALPGQSEGYWAAARDAHLDGVSPAELADTEGSDCLLTIQAPDNTSELAGGRPGAAGARGALARGDPRARDAAALVRDAVADPGGRAAGGAGDRRLRGARRARAVPRPRRPRRRVGRAARDPGAADRAARGRARAAHRGRGDRPDAERRRPHVGELRRQAQHALGRGLHRPARGLRRGRDPLHDPVEPARGAGRGDRARASPRAASSRRAPTAARPTCARRSPPTRARRGSARSASARTSASTARWG